MEYGIIILILLVFFYLWMSTTGGTGLNKDIVKDLKKETLEEQERSLNIMIETAGDDVYVKGIYVTRLLEVQAEMKKKNKEEESTSVCSKCNEPRLNKAIKICVKCKNPFNN